jgi:hypothetical protein
MPDLAPGVPSADDDVDVPVEQGIEPGESLGGKTIQLVVPEIGDARLRNSEPLRGRGLTDRSLMADSPGQTAISSRIVS